MVGPEVVSSAPLRILVHEVFDRLDLVDLVPINVEFLGDVWPVNKKLNEISVMSRDGAHRASHDDLWGVVSCDCAGHDA